MRITTRIKAKVAGTLTAALLIQFLPSTTLAWGSEGHGMVARIAQRLLTDRAKAQVREILSPSGETMVGVALWPDTIRGEEPGKRPETPHWHFVDTPLGESYDRQRDCAESTNGSCVISALVIFQDILADKKKGYHSRKFNRYEALKFLIHFAGDIHQPLHCITDKRNDPDGDSGGGRKGVIWFGSSGKNLHGIWDTFIIRRTFAENNNATVSSYSTKLFNDLSSSELAFARPPQLSSSTTVSRGMIESWARDAHEIAEDAYENLGQPDGSGKYRLGQNYYSEHHEDVDKQIKLAGVRLARILNENLR